MDVSTKHFRVVLAEDSDDDAELMQLALGNAGLEIEFIRVWDEEPFVEALEREPDLVICDYAMPQFDALRALEWVKKLCPGLPLIVVSRVVGEDAAVEAMRRGAVDYLIKDRLARLPQAVRKALERHQLERDRRQMQSALACSVEMVALCERAIECSTNAIAILDLQRPGAPVMFANQALLELSGLAHAEVLGRRFSGVFARCGDPVAIERLLLSVGVRREARAVLRCEREDGTVSWHEVHLAPVTGAGGELAHVVAVLRDVTESRQYQEELERAAHYDALTGLPNRHLFTDRLALALANVQRQRGVVGLLMVDVDRFKLINDSYGHATGDRVLRHVVDLIAARLHSGDTVARWGGDELVAIVSGVDDEGALAGFAEDLRRAIAEPFAVDGHRIAVTASLGVALYPRDGEDGAALLQSAELAVYRAKQLGRNQWRFAQREVHARLRGEMALQSELYEALAATQLHLVYQPIIAVDSGRVVGAEALLRWDHPRRGLLLPADFIHLAERSGLIVPIGEWVLETVCRQLAQWGSGGRADLRLSMNVSARQLRHGEFSGAIKRALVRHNIAPERLELEISESCAAHDDASTLAALDEIKRHGVMLALDDFGVGATSISALTRLPMDRIKLERGLINGLPDSREARAVVSGLLGILHELGFISVAAGVERPQQLEMLRGLDCDEAQGFLISRPVPAAQLEAFLSAQRMLPR